MIGRQKCRSFFAVNLVQMRVESMVKYRHHKKWRIRGMCEYCENGKNLFLTHENFGAKKDTSEMIIKYPETGNVIVASEDTHSIYDKPTRTIRRIVINYCPVCGKKLH